MANEKPRGRQRPRPTEKKRLRESERKSSSEQDYGARKPPRLEGKPVERRNNKPN